VRHHYLVLLRDYRRSSYWLFKQFTYFCFWPAAGLAAIVLVGISDLGSFELFLVAGIIAGIIQLILGFVRAVVFLITFQTM
jgi:hypothetical protein